MACEALVIDPKLVKVIQKMPKVELHVHLEGTIEPHTAIALMQRNDPAAPLRSEEEVRQLYRFGNLSEFVRAMRSVSNNIVRLQDLTRVADEMFARLAEQQVRYVEFDCALQKYIDLGFGLPEVVEALDDSARRAKRETGIDSRLVVNLQRQHGEEKTSALVKAVARLGHPLIVGIGLSGDETRYPQKDFGRTFAAAREAGLHRTVHAGEALPPVSIWDALNHLAAERIDHGTTASQDESLMEFLAAHRIPLTQCLRSNLRLNVVAEITDHPFARFFRRGLLVSLHTDDPQVFDTTLTDEFLLAAESFSFTFDDVRRIVLNGVDSSFLPEPDRAALSHRIEGEFDRCRS